MTEYQRALRRGIFDRMMNKIYQINLIIPPNFENVSRFFCYLDSTAPLCQKCGGEIPFKLFLKIWLTQSKLTSCLISTLEEQCLPSWDNDGQPNSYSCQNLVTAAKYLTKLLSNHLDVMPFQLITPALHSTTWEIRSQI